MQARLENVPDLPEVDEGRDSGSERSFVRRGDGLRTPARAGLRPRARRFSVDSDGLSLYHLRRML